MLYEVITDCRIDERADVVESGPAALQRDARFSGRQHSHCAVSVRHTCAGGTGGRRITSYNVCYTKLLRM